MQATPLVSIEVDAVTSPATTTAVLDGPERDRLWDQHVAQLPHFAAYPETAGRLIPMVRIRRSG